jgi:Uma2 family endonuclease
LLAEEFFVGVEVSVQLTDNTIVQPDIVVGPEVAVMRTPEAFLAIPAAQILLLAEVAASSLAYDRGRKARLYAREGIAEYWVFDANQSRGWIYREPSPEGFRSVRPLGADDEFRPAVPPSAPAALSTFIRTNRVAALRPPRRTRGAGR